MTEQTTSALPSAMATKPSRHGHLPINGLSLYHEVYGELGTSKTVPLLLIPGAFMATDPMTSWVSAFAGRRTVIVFDQQRHGRTPASSWMAGQAAANPS